MVLRLRQRELGLAFASWHAHVMTVREREGSIGRGVARVTKGALVRSFARLVANVSACRRGRRAIVRVTHMKAAWVLGAWSVWVAEQHAVRRRLGKIVARMQWRLVASAFEGWLSGVEACRHERAVMGRAVARLSQLVMSRANERWVAFVASCRRARRCLARVLNMRLRQRFSMWVGQARGARDGRIAEEARLLKLRRMMARWTMGQVAAAFTTWLDMHRHRRRLLRMVLRLRQRQLGSAFASWQYFAVFSRTRKAYFVKFMCTNVTRNYFEQWLSAITVHLEGLLADTSVRNVITDTNLRYAFLSFFVFSRCWDMHL